MRTIAFFISKPKRTIMFIILSFLAVACCRSSAANGKALSQARPVGSVRREIISLFLVFGWGQPQRRRSVFIDKEYQGTWRMTAS
jgi:hypothetical protein